MNSLLFLGSTPSSAPAPALRDAAALDPTGAPFSAFLTLAAAGTEAAALPVQGEAAPLLASPADLVPLPGIALPPVSGSGKFLPEGLPGSSDAEPREEEGSEQGGLDLAATPSLVSPFMMPLPQPTLPQPALAQPSAGSPAGAALPAGTAPTLQPPPLRLDGAMLTATSAAPPEALAGEEVELPPAPGKEPAVVVTMDSTPAETRARTQPREGEPQLARIRTAHAPVSAEQPADQQPGQTPSKDTGFELPARFPAAPAPSTIGETSVASLSSAQPAPASSPALAATAPTPPAAVQDLSAIVDRLAAAREAMAPATAALALHHAEFGEMTLRFDQQQDGQLTVGLAASNAEAHRAVAAAIAAERNPSPGGDRPNGESQQQNGQARTGNGAGHGTGSGNGGLDRGGSGSGGNQPGSGQTRHDSPRDNPARQGWRPTSRGEDPQGGIYA